MTAAAYQRAARCFALARSTTFPAERETAIARGIRVAEAAGLSLDLFDIPSRVRAVPPPHRSRAHPDDLQSDLEEVLRRCANGTGDIFADYAAAAFARAGIQAGETIADAQRRIFERAVAEAKERDASRPTRPETSRGRHDAFEAAQQGERERMAQRGRDREMRQAHARFEKERTDELRRAQVGMA